MPSTLPANRKMFDVVVNAGGRGAPAIAFHVSHRATAAGAVGYTMGRLSGAERKLLRSVAVQLCPGVPDCWFEVIDEREPADDD